MKKKNRNKIQSINITEDMIRNDDMDEAIKQILIAEADAYEEELNAKRELDHIQPPDEMYNKIMRRIDKLELEKENKILEEEMKHQKKKKEDVPGRFQGSAADQEKEVLDLMKGLRSRDAEKKVLVINETIEDLEKKEKGNRRSENKKRFRIRETAGLAAAVAAAGAVLFTAWKKRD